jgi:hypothetical protein
MDLSAFLPSPDLYEFMFVEMEIGHLYQRVVDSHGSDGASLFMQLGVTDGLEFIRDHSTLKWDEWGVTCSEARDLHTMKWARSQGCPWGHACSGRDVATLTWLRDQGCPLEISYNDHLESMKWIMTRDPQIDLFQVYLIHVHLDQDKMVFLWDFYLKMNEWQMVRTMFKHAKEFGGRAFRVLTVKAWDVSIKYRNTQLIMFLFTNGFSVEREVVVGIAKKYGDPRMMRLVSTIDFE